MAARSPAEAVEVHRQELQRILSCVTNGVLSAVGGGQGNPYQPDIQPHAFLLGEGQFNPLSGTTPFLLRVAFRYEIVADNQRGRAWEVRTLDYAFTLALRERDRAVELITYHWQPGVQLGKPWPHLHLGPAIAGASNEVGTRHAHRLHFPTGIVPLSTVIRMSIEELGVRPLRDDWDQILTREHDT